MTDTETRWALKQDMDWTAPSDIVVNQGGTPLDVSTWTATAHARVSPESDTEVEFTIERPAATKLRLKLTRTQTAAMEPGEWELDVKVAPPADAFGVDLSQTIKLDVERAITR